MTSWSPLEGRGWVEHAADALQLRGAGGQAGAARLLAELVEKRSMTANRAQVVGGAGPRGAHRTSPNVVRVYLSSLRVALRELGLGEVIVTAGGVYGIDPAAAAKIDHLVRTAAGRG